MKIIKRKPELIAPVGEWSSLTSALEAGADAVYFGLRQLNMRRSAENFDILQMEKIMERLHSSNKKGYLTLNTIIYNNEIHKLRKILEAAASSDVDGIILWDGAALKTARELGLKIHLSTQASVSNIEALKFYISCGIKRAVLARECSLSDIKEITSCIKKENLDCEIEAFVHGAMCVSISGRCFLSHDAFKKSANRGECLQPCRRKFSIKDLEGESEYILGEDYVLSPKDLCTLPFIDKLIEAGISAFKIEGRMRSPEYVKVVTSAYREAIDAYYQRVLNSKLKGQLLKRIGKVHNRGFTSGFYLNIPEDTGARARKDYNKIYLGDIRKYYKKICVAELLIRGAGLKIGDEILVTGKNTSAAFTEITQMQIDHSPVKSVKKGQAVGIKLPFPVHAKDKVFLWEKSGS